MLAVPPWEEQLPKIYNGKSRVITKNIKKQHHISMIKVGSLEPRATNHFVRRRTFFWEALLESFLRSAATLASRMGHDVQSLYITIILK